MTIPLPSASTAASMEFCRDIKQSEEDHLPSAVLTASCIAGGNFGPVAINTTGIPGTRWSVAKSWNANSDGTLIKIAAMMAIKFFFIMIPFRLNETYLRTNPDRILWRIQQGTNFSLGFYFFQIAFFCFFLGFRSKAKKLRNSLWCLFLAETRPHISGFGFSTHSHVIGKEEWEPVTLQGYWDPTSPLTLVQESGKDRFSKITIFSESKWSPLCHSTTRLRD